MSDPAITEPTMYNFQDCGETKKESLEPDDINAICTIYPTANDPGPARRSPTPAAAAAAPAAGPAGPAVLLGIVARCALRRDGADDDLPGVRRRGACRATRGARSVTRRCRSGPAATVEGGTALEPRRRGCRSPAVIAAGVVGLGVDPRGSALRGGDDDEAAPATRPAATAPAATADHRRSTPLAPAVRGRAGAAGRRQRRRRLPTSSSARSSAQRLWSTVTVTGLARRRPARARAAIPRCQAPIAAPRLLRSRQPA